MGSAVNLGGVISLLSFYVSVSAGHQVHEYAMYFKLWNLHSPESFIHLVQNLLGRFAPLLAPGVWSACSASADTDLQVHKRRWLQLTLEFPSFCPAGFQFARARGPSRRAGARRRERREDILAFWCRGQGGEGAKWGGTPQEHLGEWGPGNAPPISEIVSCYSCVCRLRPKVRLLSVLLVSSVIQTSTCSVVALCLAIDVQMKV